MPVKYANSTSYDLAWDFQCLHRRFSGASSGYVLMPIATSDESLHDEDDDLELLRDAIASSDNTISYEQFRQELGLH